MNRMRLTLVNFMERVYCSHSTNKLVSNASAKLFAGKTESCIINVLLGLLKLESQWEVALLVTSYPSFYWTVKERKFMFSDEKPCWKWSHFIFLEPGLNHSNTVFVEAMNTLFQLRHHHNESCIAVQMCRGMQKIKVCYVYEGSSLEFFGTNLGHNLGSIVGNEFRLVFRENRPNKPDWFPVISAYTLKNSSKLIEYKFADGTNAPLLRCFLIPSKVKLKNL